MAERRDKRSAARAGALVATVFFGVILTACEMEDERDDAPLITTSRVRPHPDRGPCTGCHVVAPSTIASRGPAPSITPHQPRPHPDRGACTRCHAVGQ